MLRKSLILVFAFAAIATALPTGNDAARLKRQYLTNGSGLGYSGLHEGYGYQGSSLGSSFGSNLGSSLGYGGYPGGYSGHSGYSGYEDYGHLGVGDRYGGYPGYRGGFQTYKK